MAAVAATNGETEDLLWSEFCEKNARKTAVDFAQSYRLFVNDHPNVGKVVSNQEISKKFIDFFIEYFDSELKKKTTENSVVSSANGHQEIVPGDAAVRVRPKSQVDTSQENIRESNHHGDYSDLSDPEGESPKSTHHHHHPRAFFRRLSFKGLKRGKGLFHKQHSDEVELSHERRARGDKHEKAKLAKIIVENVREGMVSYLTGDYLDGRQKWERCRLLLVKTTGGYMLEFYSPPKVSLELS